MVRVDLIQSKEEVLKLFSSLSKKYDYIRVRENYIEWKMMYLGIERFEYDVLTDKTVIIYYGDKWIFNEGSKYALVVDLPNGDQLQIKRELIDGVAMRKFGSDLFITITLKGDEDGD